MAQTQHSHQRHYMHSQILNLMHDIGVLLIKCLPIFKIEVIKLIHV